MRGASRRVCVLFWHYSDGMRLFRRADQAVPPVSLVRDPYIVAWEQLLLVHEQVRYADGKLASLLAASGVAGGLLVTLAVEGDLEKAGGVPWAIVSIIFMFLSFIFSAAGILPRLWQENRRLENESMSDEQANPFFFGHIHLKFALDPAAYSLLIKRTAGDDELLILQISKQVVVNSGIASRKFKWAGRAAWSTVAQVGALAISAVLVGFLPDGP